MQLTETWLLATVNGSKRSDLISDFAQKLKAAAERASVRYQCHAFGNDLFEVFAEDFKRFMEEFLQQSEPANV